MPQITTPIAAGVDWLHNAIWPLTQFGARSTASAAINAAAVANAEAASSTQIFVPDGTYATGMNPYDGTSFKHTYAGAGTLQTSNTAYNGVAAYNTESRGRIFHAWSGSLPNSNVAPNTALAAPQNPQGWFNGNWSNCVLPIEVLIDVPVVASPVAGTYYQPYEASPIALQIYAKNGSLVTTSTGTDFSSTNLIGMTFNLNHDGGGGGLGAIFVNAHISRTYAGFDPTHPIATATTGILSGQIYAEAANVYLNGIEYFVISNGHDVSGSGMILDMNRDTAAAAHNVWWGFLVQSIGTVAIDQAYYASGKCTYGLDLTQCTFGSEGTAILIPAGMGIDLNALNNAPGSRAGGLGVFYNSSTKRIKFYGATVGLGAPGTAGASLNIPIGAAPTSPQDGDMWYDGTNVKFRVGATTKTFTLT